MGRVAGGESELREVREIRERRLGRAWEPVRWCEETVMDVDGDCEGRHRLNVLGASARGVGYT